MLCASVLLASVYIGQMCNKRVEITFPKPTQLLVPSLIVMLAFDLTVIVSLLLIKRILFEESCGNSKMLPRKIHTRML